MTGSFTFRLHYLLSYIQDFWLWLKFVNRDCSHLPGPEVGICKIKKRKFKTCSLSWSRSRLLSFFLCQDCVFFLFFLKSFFINSHLSGPCGSLLDQYVSVFLLAYYYCMQMRRRMVLKKKVDIRLEEGFQKGVLQVSFCKKVVM